MKAEQLDKFLISSESTVVEAMQKIDSNARGILFVTDNKQKLTGVLTDGDIRRWLIRTGDLQAAIEKFMNTAPKKIVKKNKTGQKCSCSSIRLQHCRLLLLKVLYQI